MSLKRLLAGALLAAAGAWAALAWPRLNDVETGRSPEYPDLQVREYAASPEAVSSAVIAVVSRLPRWRLLGSGSGSMGSEVRALHSTLVFRFKDDVVVKIRRVQGRTRVSVRSSSRLGQWDFGQNARNIRELLAALDEELRGKPPLALRQLR